MGSASIPPPKQLSRVPVSSVRTVWHDLAVLATKRATWKRLFHGIMERFLFASLILSALCFPQQTCAQFTDAHNYDNTPVGINQIELSYTYAHGNSSIDTSLVVEDAKLNLSQGMVS